MKYLGILLSTTKLLKCAWQPLVDKVADKLPLWKGQLLRRTGHLTLIRTTLSAIPIFTVISLELPHWVIKVLVKIMRSFLCCGTDEVQGGKCLVAWHQVQRPLFLGGLGIVDLKRFGMALRLRWLWLDRTEVDRPWTSLPPKEDPEAASFFQASITCFAGNGHSIRFWQDPWLNGKAIQDLAPDLVVVVPKWHRIGRTVVAALHGHTWIRDVAGSYTVPVIMQYLHVRVLVDEVALDSRRPDLFHCRWSPSGLYSASLTYQATFQGQTALFGARELWKVKVPNKCRMFIWLVLQERCWTAER
jgi:hypothetical protein